MTVQLDSEPFLQLQKQIDLVWINAGAFVKELGEERQYDLSFLEEEDPALVKLAKTYSCRLTRSLATFDEVSEWMKTNNALFGLEEELQALRKELAEIFEDMAKVGEGYKADGEVRMPDVPSEDIYIEETPSTEKVFEGVGLFGEVDLTKEKERVLFGLDLLRKEFLRITERVEKGDGMQHWLHHPEKKENEFLESINGWEKALREWQQDLKLYRKDAGNFSCALDGYTILEMKIWQYGEDDGAELQKAHREHLQKTQEMLAETERQIREFEK